MNRRAIKPVHSASEWSLVVLDSEQKKHASKVFHPVVKDPSSASMWVGHQFLQLSSTQHEYESWKKIAPGRSHSHLQQSAPLHDTSER